MEFEERIQKIIADGLQRVEEEQQLDRDFGIRWSEARSTVWTVLARAKRTAQNSLGELADPEHTNGCTVLSFLRGGPRGATVAYQLKFCRNDETRRIDCSVKPPDLIPEDEGFPESFILDALTENVIEDKTAAFFGAILKHMAEKRPSPRRTMVLR